MPRFQFRLRTIFVFVTGLAIGLGSAMYVMHKRTEAMREQNRKMYKILMGNDEIYDEGHAP